MPRERAASWTCRRYQRGLTAKPLACRCVVGRRRQPVEADNDRQHQHNRLFDFSADGSGTLNLSALTSLNGTGGNNSLSDTAGGTILDANLKTINDVKVTVDGTGTMAASQWTALTNSTLTVTGGVYTLSGLTDVTGSSVYVQSGGSLSLPGVTSYANPTSWDDTYFQATGAGSILDVSALNGVGLLQSNWYVQASSSGTVNLSKLTTINSTGTTDYFRFSADGSGSKLDLSALTSLIGTGSNNSLSDTG